MPRPCIETVVLQKERVPELCAWKLTILVLPVPRLVTTLSGLEGWGERLLFEINADLFEHLRENGHALRKQRLIGVQVFDDATTTNMDLTLRQAGSIWGYVYDQADRGTGITNEGPSGLLSSYAYQYDANGNRSLQLEQNGGAVETTSYQYDAADRLWQVAYPDQTTTYTLDGVGNRRTETSVQGEDTIVDREYRYDARHRLTEIVDRLDPLAGVLYGITNGLSWKVAPPRYA